MKVKELAEQAESELKSENDKKVVTLLKCSFKKVEAARKTLKLLEKNHLDLLEMDVEELELDDYEY